jgi:hypothetical protein
MNTPVLKRRGRPRLGFLQDPDRFLLAIAIAFPDLGTSRKGAIEITIAAIEGYAIGPNLKPGWGRGLNLLYDQYAMRPVPGRAASIGNRERELRRKLKRALKDPAAVRWLAAMSEATLLALRVVVPAHGTAGELIMELADTVGERTFAHDVLLELWRLQSLRQIERACRVLPVSNKLPSGRERVAF